MKKLFVVLLALLIVSPAFASNTTGYAWSESLGWFDFTNTTVSDDGITGYAYNDNSGWLAMDGVINTNGVLSGFAWSESVGYFDFSNVSVSDGVFEGYAYNDNSGWLSFGPETSAQTSWTPTSSRKKSGKRSSSSEVTAVFGLANPVVEVVQEESLKVFDQNIPEVLSEPIVVLGSNNPLRNLQIGDSGIAIKGLQIILNHLGYKIAEIGPGSPGNETDFFGPSTKEAVIKFQLANNIQPAAGYFGPLTRDTLIKSALSTIKINN